MPRDFDSDQNPAQLQFVERVDCPHCGLMFDGRFVDDSDTVQDLTDAPQGCHRCPGCGHEWVSGLSGWTFFSEAG